jgi:exopolyphosphatase/guanosine-5'-triphosphate,3'-diphosphate pyrophosphatase
MPVLAALDVGSNALRLAIGEVDESRHLTVLEGMREAVRLGQDTFTHGSISEESIEAAVTAFQRFRDAIARRGAVKVRAVATSAVREALNCELFVDRIASTSGIDIEVIGPEEEARLIHLAVIDKVNLKNKLALLIDIGGGSSEITFASDVTILSTESFRIGAVRLLQMLEEKKHGQARFTVLLSEYMEAVRKRIARDIGDRTFDLCVGTGGNIEALADLVKPLLDRDRDGGMKLGDLDELIKRLQALTFEERVQDLGLRPDRSDVIVPAALVLRTIMRAAKVEELAVPKVGLKEGLLLDMGDELYGNRRTARRDQVVAAALQLGKKYGFDEQHGVTVSRYAVQLFDQTKSIHNLGIEHRLLLEVAAMLHDVGAFVNVSEHHKHTLYIITNSPLVGLTKVQTAIIGNVARYHRKSPPKIQHDGYRLLSAKERVVVSKLAAILRLADALDNEHASRVTAIAVEFKKPKLMIRLKGEGDMMLEKWATMKRAAMFEQVFNVRVVIEE